MTIQRQNPAYGLVNQPYIKNVSQKLDNFVLSSLGTLFFYQCKGQLRYLVAYNKQQDF